MTTSPTDQCIVLPFGSANRQAFGGTGLALHFLLGNVLVLHTELKEMWFGWRVKKIFPQQAAFQGYCRDAGITLDLDQVSRSQKIRFWITGSYTGQAVSLQFFDSEPPYDHTSTAELKLSLNDGLVGFRSRFMDWLAATGHPMPANQIQPALWPETVTRDGLDAVGRALEGFYIYSAYGGDGPLDVSPFRKAAAAAPESFMAQDLYGWALYRIKNYAEAKEKAEKALALLK